MFDVPVCNVFQPQILNNQLCYVFDPNRFKKLINAEVFKEGLTFYVDVNKDRQVVSSKDDFMIYLNTLGT